MEAKDFFDWLEKNNMPVTIEQMQCIDESVPFDINWRWNGRYYFVWVVSGGDVVCSGKKGEPLANVVNRWALIVEEYSLAK